MQIKLVVGEILAKFIFNLGQMALSMKYNFIQMSTAAALGCMDAGLIFNNCCIN